MKLTVEFCGLPGSGKSTLAEHLVRHLRRDSTRILDRREAVALFLRRRNDGVVKNLLKRFPRRVREGFASTEDALAELHRFAVGNLPLLNILFACLREAACPEMWNQCILRACFKSMIERQLAADHQRDGECVVLDEGLAHRAFTLFGYMPPGKLPTGRIREYADAIPLPDRLLLVDAVPETCEQRLSARPDLPLLLSGLDGPARIARLRHGAEGLHVVAETLERRGVQVIRLSNREGLREADERLRALAPSVLPGQ